MAISKEQIIETAEKLSAEGTKPTMAAVREALGGGSFATISPILKEWRESRDERASVALEMPAEAKAALDRAGADIWGAVTALATEKLEKVSADADAAVVAANSDRDEALAEIERLEALVQQQKDDIKKAIDSLGEESNRLIASKKAVHALEIKVAEKEHVEAENKALLEELATIKIDIQSLTTEKLDLTGTVKDLEHNLTGTVKDLEHKSTDCDKLKLELAETNKENSTLTNQNKSFESQVDKQQLALDMSDKQIKELKSELKASKKEVSECSEMRGELRAIKEQSAIFSSYQLLMKKVDEQSQS